jgi:prepilin-type N-terminal cleavage/methylation domain-containing protein
MLHRPSGSSGTPRGVTLVELMLVLGLFAIVMVAVVGVWEKVQESYFVGSDAADIQQNIRTAMDFMVRDLRSAGRDVTLCAFSYTSPSGSGDCDATKAAACRNAPPPETNKNLGALGYTASGCQGIFAIPVADATVTTVRIRADRNGSGTIAGTANAAPTDPGDENVLYAYELAASGHCPEGVPACITRDDGTGPVAMVAVNIAGLQFTYYPRPGYGPCAGSPAPDPCPPFAGLANQRDADNIGRIHLSVTALVVLSGVPLSRTLKTDVLLRNR